MEFGALHASEHDAQGSVLHVGSMPNQDRTAVAVVLVCPPIMLSVCLVLQTAAGRISSSGSSSDTLQKDS